MNGEWSGRLRRLLAGILLILSPLPVLSQSAPLQAPVVRVLSADLGAMARIELDWPVPFEVSADTSARRLILVFDRPFNAPDLGALRMRLGHWIAGVDKRADRITLTAAEDVYFDVYRSLRQLTVEMTIAPGTAPAAERAAPAARAAPVLTPPGPRDRAPAAPGPVAGNTARPSPPPPPARPDEALAAEPSASPSASRLRRTSDPFAETVNRSWSERESRVAQLSAPPRVTATGGEEGAEIVIDWAGPVRVDARATGRELLLRLDRPVAPDMVAGLAEGLPAWLESASAGYDSLLFVAARPVDFDALTEAGRTRVTLAATDTAREERDAADVRLDVLRARLKARTGETGEAREALQELRTENPENPDVLVELANLEQSVGAWRRAGNLYDRAVGLDPERRDIAAARRALEREFGPYVRLDADYQQVQDGDTQVIAVLSGRVLPTEEIDAGFSLENRFLDDDEVLRANGVLDSVSAHFQRGEVYAGGSPAPGHRVEGALLFGAGTPGGSLRYSHRTPASLTTVSGTWHRAYWELVEGIVDDAVQDRLAVRHERQLDRRWSAQGEIGLNRFGIAGIDTAATTWDAAFAIRYLVPWEAADLTVGYSFDGQYVVAQARRRDQNGNVFEPLPLNDTEFHSLDLSLGQALGGDWRYNAFLSLTVDRFGGFGPSLGGELVWDADEDVQLGLRAGHSRVSGRGDDAVLTTVGGHLLVRF
jgi:tetratricopeptide (TPR) repeat protein